MKRLLLALLLVCVVGCSGPDPLFHKGQMVRLLVNGEQGQITYVHDKFTRFYTVRVGREKLTLDEFELEAIE
jgi:hypothetical protein